MNLRKYSKLMIKKIDPFLLSLCQKSRFLSAVYYTVFNSGFSYEQRAFIAGRAIYYDRLTNPEGSMAILRRNTHRLEKGLIMKPRREMFALDYIGETINAYTVALESKNIDHAELQWASDVLENYFEVCSLPAELEELKKVFETAKVEFQGRGEKQVPYYRNLEDRLSVSYEDLLCLSKRRRSVRWFLDKTVPRSLIDKAIELAAWSPSACNRMPYSFYIYDDPTKVQKIVNLPGGLAGYGHNVKTIVVLIGDQSSYFDERDRHLIYIDGSLATMSFIYALETMGLSTCCINWPEIAARDDRMSKALGLRLDQRPIMLIAVGYPDPEGLVPRSTKKSLDNLRVYNKV